MWLTSRERTVGLVDLLRREPECGAYIRDLVVDVNPGRLPLAAVGPDGVSADQLSAIFACLTRIDLLELRLDAETLDGLTLGGIQGLVAARPADVLLEGCGPRATPGFWPLARALGTWILLLEMRFVRLGIAPVVHTAPAFGRLLSLNLLHMEPAEEIAVMQACASVRTLAIEGGGEVLDAMPSRFRSVITELDPGVDCDDIESRHVVMLPALTRFHVPVDVDEAVLDHLPSGITSLNLVDDHTIKRIARRLRERDWLKALRTIEVYPPGSDRREDYRVRRAAKDLDTPCRARRIELAVY